MTRFNQLKRSVARTFLRHMHSRYDGRRQRVFNQIMFKTSVTSLKRYLNTKFFMISNWGSRQCAKLIRQYDLTTIYLMIRNDPNEALHRLR